MSISKRTFREMLVCTPVIFNQILFGLGYGWLAPTLAKLQDSNSTLSATSEQVSWIASLHEIGRVAGPFISPFIVDRIGRKYGVILVTILLFLMWPSQIYLHSVTVLCVIRVLFGIVNGVSDVVMSVYITESCSPKFRAVLGPFTSVTFATGSSLGLIIATYLTLRNTAIVNTAISACAFSALYYCMETPSFLILRGKYAKADRNLRWLRGSMVVVGEPPQVNKELEKLKQSVQEEKLKQKSLRALFSSTANVRSLFIVLSMYVFGSGHGGNATGAYAVLILQPTQNLSSYQLTILGGILHTLALCISPLIVSKISRRRLIVVGYALIAFCHVGIWLLIHLHNRNFQIVFYPWLVFSSLTLSGSLVAWVSPALFVVRVELLPLSVRALGSSGAVVASGLTGFAISKIFQPLTSTFGLEANFLVYAIMCASCSVFVYFTLPETRGKTLDQIQESLEKKPAGG